MSFFQSNGFILKTQVVKDSILLDIFTNQFGRLKLQTKKSKNKIWLDAWYLINFEIQVKDQRHIHEVFNIKILKQFPYESFDFQHIYLFLECMNFIHKNTPEWVEVTEIFTYYNAFLSQETLTLSSLIVCYLKIGFIIGVFPLTDDENFAEIFPLLQEISKNTLTKNFSWKEFSSLQIEQILLYIKKYT